MYAYNLFRSTGPDGLSCAVPEARSVPPFVVGPHWRFEGRLDSPRAMPLGFDKRAADTVCDSTGFICLPASRRVLATGTIGFSSENRVSGIKSARRGSFSHVVGSTLISGVECHLLWARLRPAASHRRFAVTSSFSLIWTITAAATLLQAGNGLLQALMPLRMQAEGLPISAIGIVAAAYGLGFSSGCFLAPLFIRHVGYIRAFASLAAIVSVLVLAMTQAHSTLAWALLARGLGHDLRVHLYGDGRLDQRPRELVSSGPDALDLHDVHEDRPDAVAAWHRFRQYPDRWTLSGGERGALALALANRGDVHGRAAAAAHRDDQGSGTLRCRAVRGHRGLRGRPDQRPGDCDYAGFRRQHRA